MITGKQDNAQRDYNGWYSDINNGNIEKHMAYKNLLHVREDNTYARYREKKGMR